MTGLDGPTDGRGGEQRRRSSYWFDGDDINGFNHRAWMKPNGFSDEAMFGPPCHRDRATPGASSSGATFICVRSPSRSRRGVLQGGGLPLEFPVSPCPRR